MIYTVHGGHAVDGNSYSGAVGLLNESIEDRLVKEAIIRYLKKEGISVYDCTVDKGISQTNILSQICNKCNSLPSDLNISIHFNSGRNDSPGDGKQGGFEVYATAYSGIKKEAAERIVSNMKALGFTMHGSPLKTTKGLYFLNHTKAPALLLEICFVDDRDDYNIYKRVGADAVGKAIAEGILNKSIAATNIANTQEAKDMNKADIQLYEANGTDAQKWKAILNKDGTYSFQNKACGYMLDIPGASTKNLTKMQAYKQNGTAAQRFKLVQCKGYSPANIAAPYIIQSVLGDLCVDCESGKTVNGTKIQTCNINNTNAQKWVVVDDGQGYWTFINVNSGKAIDVVGGGK